jgi:hypothetical protein
MEFVMVFLALSASLAPMAQAFCATPRVSLPRGTPRPAGGSPGTEWLQQDAGGNYKVRPNTNNYNERSNVPYNDGSRPGSASPQVPGYDWLRNDGPPASTAFRQGNFFPPPQHRPPHSYYARNMQNPRNSPNLQRQGSDFFQRSQMNSNVIKNLDANDYARPQQGSNFFSRQRSGALR